MEPQQNPTANKVDYYKITISLPNE